MAYATASMAVLLDPAEPELIERKGREFLAFDAMASELRWHPREITDRRIVGIENLIAARDLGRGVVLSFAHHAYFAGTFGAVHDAGVPHGVVVADAIAGPDAGPNMRQHIRIVGRAGEIVRASEGTKGFVKRLRAGEVLAIASDVPGSNELTFAGRTVGCSSGAAWAAVTADSPVVYITQERDEQGPYARIWEPIEPGEFDNGPDLLAAIIRHHEEAILRWPEAAYHPLLCWQPPQVKPGPAEPAQEGLSSAAASRRLRLITIDQLLSGGSNVLVAMAAAHVLSTADFGLYGIVAMTYILTLGAARALVHDPILVHPEEAIRRRPEVIGANLSLGVATGVLVALAGVGVRLLNPALGDALLILAACTPLLALQDLGRYLGIVSQRPGRAIVLDSLWLVILAAFLPLLATSDAKTLPMFVLAWAGAGAVAGLLVPVYYNRPFFAAGWQWLKYTWWFSWRYLASYLTTQSAGLGALVGVGAIAGPGQLGGVQGSILMVRPYGLVQAAVTASAVSEIARSTAGTDEVRRHALRTSKVATLIALVNTVVMLVLPDALGRLVLGGTWQVAKPLLLATGVQIIFIGLQTGLRAGLLGRKQAQYVVTVDIIATIYTMIGVFVGADLHGALGAVWGATIAQGFSVLVWWRILRWRTSVGALEPVAA